MSHPRPSRSSPGLSHTQSWVEVASQPSSSSLSSIGDEIVTTGLRIGGPYNRRRRLQPPARSSLPHQQTAVHAAGTSSSQEEYEESESEDDGLLTSSAENVQPAPSGNADECSDADSDSDGDDATALGRASDRPVFRPQPNAFSHPPVHAPQRSHSATSSMPSHPHSGFTRPSFSQRSQTRVHRDGPSFMSPSAREDNDAALRASLTTLLSCAAAARGLPKSKDEAEARRVSRNGVGPSDQPMELRLVPESELMEGSTQPRTVTAGFPRRQRSPARLPTETPTQADKPKRSGSAGRSPRANKKKKVVVSPEETTLISPTLLTWVVSAGVIVLVSVVGFGAGYVIGREVGRQETQDALSASMSAASETSHTGREVIRSSGGLRRLRWGARAVSKSIAAQA
ncbi:hypothetical protein ED733_002899 [Metarhizium rileyi]|uniref:Uncharacterized protein n=1 Tax=Metarhizium rileyi (strain RCEF 4871) TaxID=1649241 RepID=A0A5C6GN26_METRR|nr:hypothetical protein ED733_002899 [Metarhizium rileyi]